MAESSTLLRSARTQSRLTQVELASRAGVAQSVISAYESGRREPSLRTLERLVAATGFDLDIALRVRPRTSLRERVSQHREALIDALSPLGASRVRLFGSAARGDDADGSDVDLLVDLRPGTGLFALARMTTLAEDILGVSVDVVPADSLKDHVASGALADAVDV